MPTNLQSNKSRLSLLPSFFCSVSRSFVQLHIGLKHLLFLQQGLYILLQLGQSLRLAHPVLFQNPHSISIDWSTHLQDTRDGTE